MKKTTLGIILLETILILVTFSYNILGIGAPKNIEFIVEKELSGGEVASFNYYLKYIMPSDFQDSLDSFTEIDISNPQTMTRFGADIETFENNTPEAFINSMIENEADTSLEEVVNETVEINGKIITKKIMFAKSDNPLIPSIYNFAGTIEDKNRPDEFIGVVGISFDEKEIETFNNFINSISFTKHKSDEITVYDNLISGFEVSLPNGFRKFKRTTQDTLFKLSGDNIAYAMIVSDDDKDTVPEEFYNLLKTNFPPEYKIVEEDIITDFKDKTITKTKFEVVEQEVTIEINLVKFKNTNKSVLIRFDSGGKDRKIFEQDFNFILNNLKVK